MKLFSVVLFVGLAACVCAQEGQGVTLAALIKKCADASGTDVATVQNSMGNPNPDSKVKCTVSCICEKIGIMNSDGGPNKAVAADLIEKLGEKGKALKPTIDKCMGAMKPGLAKCESGWLAAKCALSAMGKGKQ